ncbi:MAG TPA: non-canonical purine NTP pyrophosphatase [Candidatus Saccharimonas sp.]|nr:non-canonical purine NTP pyrophosphatase [Candidatus Saccharimonas sp.]
MTLTLITGNEHKATQVAKWLGRPIEHKKIDLDEIQSTNLNDVVAHKATQAYGIVGSPVLVEDTSFECASLNGLPGPFVKWFLQDLGNDKMAQLAQTAGSDRATVRIIFGLYDGKEMTFFDAAVGGTIVTPGRGTNGFGFDFNFVPDGATKTFAEMTDDEKQPFSHRAQALKKVAEFLANA